MSEREHILFLYFASYEIFLPRLEDSYRILDGYDRLHYLFDYVIIFQLSGTIMENWYYDGMDGLDVLYRSEFIRL